jgi:hypothetical protein
MAAAETEASTTSAGPLRRRWEKIATVLAVIGLVDLTGQLIKWAALIHWVAEKYAAIRTWAFSWLPFHIPPKWHDPIVLSLVTFSVLHVYVYQKTGRSSSETLRNDQSWNRLVFLTAFITIGIVGWISMDIDIFTHLQTVEWTSRTTDIIPVVSVIIYIVAVISIAPFIAWRWILITAAFFGALVLFNQAYLIWLEPLAEHH